MKLLLLLTLVGLAASRTLPTRGVPQQFLYQYDSQIATGIEEVSNQFSTMRMRFQVLMQTDGSLDTETGAQRWTVTFKKVNIRQRNNATEQLPKTMLPMEMFRNLESPELWRQIESALKQPFEADIQPQLSIARIRFEKEDPFWSVNVKKGFLQLLQLNFLPSGQSIESQEKGQWTKEEDEMTVADVCKTFYSVEKVRFHEAVSKVFKVEKAIDFNNCRNPIDATRDLPGMWNGLQHSDRIPTEMNKQFLTVNNFGKFFVFHAAESNIFLVKKASVRTIYTMAPFTESMHGSEKVIAMQKLKLLEKVEETPIVTSELVEQPEGLRLIFPEEAKKVNRKALLNEIVELLKVMKTHKYDDTLDMKVYEQILRIVRFHVKESEQLMEIVQKLKETEGIDWELRQSLIRIFILDICPQANTNATVQFLMKVVRMIIKMESRAEWIESVKLGVEHIPIIFSKFSLMGKIQMKTLKIVLEVVKSDAFRHMLMTEKLVPIYSNAWLSLGGMVNVFFSRQGGVEPFLLPIDGSDGITRQYRQSPWELRQQQAIESEEFRQEFITEVRKGLQAGGLRKTLALKVIKNCGLFEFYQDLKTLILQQDIGSVTDRVHAVYATQNMLRRQTLSRLTSRDIATVMQEQKFIREHKDFIKHFDQMSRKIQADLLRCFRNVREDPEMRIACYRVLIQCPIKQATLNMLVQSVLADPSQLVYTYCVQHMMQIVNSPLPRYHHAIPTIRSALSLLKRRQPFSATFSRLFSGQMWDRLHDMGLSIETDMIVSDKSFTPRWTHFRLEHQSLGRSTPLIEIGVRTEGLQKMLEVFGPQGPLSSIKDLIHVMKKLRRSRRSIDESVMPSQLLQILPRVLQEMPDMEISVSLMGYDVVFVRNTREVRNLIRDASFEQLNNFLLTIRRNLNLLTNIFTISTNYQLPTTVGTILDLNCIATFNTQLKEPKMDIETEDEGSQVEILLGVQPVITLQTFKRIGSNMHLLNHYHQWETFVRMGLPQATQMRLQLNALDKTKVKTSFSITIPRERTQIFEFKNGAFCTIGEFRLNGDRMQMNYLKEVIQHRSIVEPKTFKTQPLINKVFAFFGINMEIQGQYYSNKQLYKGPCTLLTGPSSLTVHIWPIVETTEPLVLVGQLEYNFDTENYIFKKLLGQMSLMKSTTTDEVLVKKLIELEINPKEKTLKKQKLEVVMRYFVNLPSTYATSGFRMIADVEVELPEDLKLETVTLEGQWMRHFEWVKDRKMNMKVEIRSDEGEVATLLITQSSNEALKQLIRKMSQKQLLETYPMLRMCLNETEKRVKAEYNPIFTPSCIEQYKEFNKLSQVKLEMVRKVDWFLNRRTSPMLDMSLQKLGRYMQPFLVESAFVQVPENNRIVIVSQPSPLDMRVHHVNVTCRRRRMSWQSIQLPATPFYWAGVDPIVTAIADHVKGGAVKCTLRHSHIRTFDNVVYSIPQPTFEQIAEKQCPVLLAADCSNQKQFHVITHVKDGKKFVTLRLKQGSSWVNFEISKPAFTHSTDARLRWNGEELDTSAFEVRDHETVMFKREIFVEGKQGLLSIVRYPYAGTNMYRIHSQAHQVELLVGGPMLRTVELRVSSFYHNRICGLCGDYNWEKTQEFKGPNMEVQKTPQKMIQQYVLPIPDQCRSISQANPNIVRDYTHAHEAEISMPNFHLNSRFGEPKQRKSCHVAVQDKYVKTFNNHEVPFMSKTIQQLLKRVGCEMKLALAKIGHLDVKILLNQASKKIIVKVGENKLELPISHVALNAKSAIPEDTLPNLMVKLEKMDEHMSPFYRCKVWNSEGQVIIDILSNERVIIRDGVFARRHGICQLPHKSQLTYSSNDKIAEMIEYIAEDDRCRQTIRNHLMQCEIREKYLVPYKRHGSIERRQVKFVTQELMEMMADEPESVLVLSVNQIQDDVTPVYSTQMSFSRENGKIVRRLSVKKGVSTIADVYIYKDQSTKIRLTTGLQQVDQMDEKVTLPEGFQCEYHLSQNTLVINRPDEFYGIAIVLEEEPVIRVQRLMPHPEFENVGICGSIEPVWSDVTRTNTHDVFLKALEQTLNGRRRGGAIVTEEQVQATRRLIGRIDRVEYLPEY